MSWKAQAVLAGGWASSCNRAFRVGSDRRGEEKEEEEEEEKEERERGKPALLSYRGNRKKEMKWRSRRGKVSEMKERRRDSRH